MDPYLSSIMGAIAISQTDIISIVCVLLLIVLSAFFSACEMAFSTSNSIRLFHQAENKVKGARKAMYITENYDKTLSTILIGNNIVNILSTTLCAYLFSRFVMNATLANLLNTIVMTVLILIFGEITPKAIAKRNPEKFATKFSGILYFFIIIFTPLSFVLNKIQKLFTKKISNNNPTVTEDELESIIDTMEEEGVIDGEDADIIQGAINLGNNTAYDIMTPRVDMVCIEKNESSENLIKIFIDTQFSRIPVYDQTRDNIIGVVNQKDFVEQYFKGKKIDKLDKIIAKPLFVPENIKVDDLVRLMQKEKNHMAIVVDEYGGTSGLATMEDCLEQVFGQIYDEHDEQEEIPTIKEIDSTHYIINADIEIEEMFERLQIEHLPETDYPTLAGFLFEKAENIVSVGSEIKFQTLDDIIDKSGNMIQKNIEMHFVVTKMDGNRIREVSLEIKEDIIESD